MPFLDFVSQEDLGILAATIRKVIQVHCACCRTSGVSLASSRAEDSEAVAELHLRMQTFSGTVPWLACEVF